jgi:hypothetical protein
MPSDQTFFELFVHNFLSSFFEALFFLLLLCKFLFWSYQFTVIIEFYGFAALQKKICSRYRLFVVLPKRRLPTILEPGIDVMILKIIFNKKMAEKLIVLSPQNGNFYAKKLPEHWFSRKGAHFFRRKFVKIVTALTTDV